MDRCKHKIGIFELITSRATQLETPNWDAQQLTEPIQPTPEPLVAINSFQFL